MLSALIQSRLRYPAVHLAAQPVNRRSVHHGPLVLVTAPRKTPTPTIDRDRTVSRRSEPSSRATLMGEQPNPWDLLSTFYPLSDGVSIHVRRITISQFPACSACLPPSQAPLCYYTHLGRLPIGLRAPLKASVTLLEATTPVKLPTKQCPRNHGLDLRHTKGRISRAAPRTLACPIHSLRPILHIG